MAFIMEFRTTCKPRRERNKSVSHGDASRIHTYTHKDLHVHAHI